MCRGATPRYFFCADSDSGQGIVKELPIKLENFCYDGPSTDDGLQYRLVDVALPDYDNRSDEEFAWFFAKFIATKRSIVILARDFLFGAKTQAMLEQFIEAGGLIVKAAGNAAITWNADGIGPEIPTCQRRQLHISVLDMHLFQLLNKRPDLARGFLIVQALSKGDANVLADDSNKRGDLIPDRFIASWGDIDLKKRVSTSMACACLAGVVALLSELFPDINVQTIAQTIAQTMLDVADDYVSHKAINTKATYFALEKL